jgi:hypothetical protein
MSVENAVYNILKDNLSVSGLVGTDIYPVIAKQGVSEYIVFQTVGDIPTDTKDGVSDFNKERVQVVAWSQNHKRAREISEAAKTALDRYEGIVDGVNVDSVQYISKGDQYDEDKRYFGKRTEYYIIIKS